MLIFRLLQARVHFEDRHGSRTGAPHQFYVAFQIANLERGQAALCCAEEIAWAAEFPIRFGHFKPIRGSFQNSELCGCLFRLAGSQQNTSRFVFAATDPTPKLMQLRETESLGIFNQHYSCIWHIDADLEHSRADQRVCIAAPKTIHDLLLFRRRHPAMKQLAPEWMQAFTP